MRCPILACLLFSLFLSSWIHAFGQNSTLNKCSNLPREKHDDTTLSYSVEQALDLYNAVVYQHNLEAPRHRKEIRPITTCVYIDSGEQLAGLHLQTDTLVLVGNDIELHQSLDTHGYHLVVTGIPVDDGRFTRIERHGSAGLSICSGCSASEDALLLLHQIQLSDASNQSDVPLLHNKGSLIAVSSEVVTNRSAGVVSDSLNDSDFSYIKDSRHTVSQARKPATKLGSYNIVHLQTSSWLLSGSARRTTDAVLLEVANAKILFAQNNTFTNDASSSMVTVANLDSDYLLFEENHFQGNTRWIKVQLSDPVIINDLDVVKKNTFEAIRAQSPETFKQQLLGDSSDFPIDFRAMSDAQRFSHRLAIRQADMMASSMESPTNSTERSMSQPTLGLLIMAGASAGLTGCFLCCAMMYCCCDIFGKCSQSYKKRAHERRLHTLKGVQESEESIDGPLDAIQGCVADCPCSGNLLAQIYIHAPVLWFYMKKGGAGLFHFAFGRMLAHNHH